MKKFLAMGVDRELLQEQPTAIIEYGKQLVRRLIEKVADYEDKFTVEFSPACR